MLKKYKIVLIGAGNLATQLGLTLHEKGFEILQVFSRTIESATALATRLNAVPTNDLAGLTDVADLYIYAVKDDALEKVINTVSVKNGIHIHTSGSVPMTVFASKQANYGVFYPLQTFKKEKRVNFEEIPIFVEASNLQTAENLQIIGEIVGKNIYQTTSEDRCLLHLSAVFACNFSNYLFTVAEKILQPTNIPFSALLPLIFESVEKLKTLTPQQSQTGPAARNDKKTIEKHLNLLAKEPQFQQLYQLLSDAILQNVNP